MALAEAERSDAKTPEEVAAAQAKIDAMNAERAEGRRQVEAERKKNAALARGDWKGARAVDDAEALRARIDRYAGLGLSAEQATKDFRASLVAEAANRTPPTVADSMASVGGGGGVYSGANPVLQAQERATRAAEQAARVAEQAARSAARAEEHLSVIRDTLSSDD